MDNANQKRNENEHTMGILQDKLDIAVFEQEEVDPKQVNAILEEMERISPLEENEQEKESMWERIKEECREEFEADEKASNSVSNRKHRRNSARIRKFVLMAATLVLAVFIGANIGTYATEKKNVFEYVGDLKNGTAFRVSGDEENLSFDKSVEIYYSWNDLPIEYRKYLIVPYGIPERFQFYDVKIRCADTVEAIAITYITDNAKNNFSIDICVNENEGFKFGNLLFENECTQICKEKINNIDVVFFEDNEGNTIAQFNQGVCIYNLCGSVTLDDMQDILKQTLEKNF